MAEWDTAAIVERICNAARLPRGSHYRTVDNLLPLVDQHLRTLVLPALLAAGEGHLAATLEVSLVAGQAAYRLPWRCVRLLGVTLRNAEGRTVRDFGRATPAQALEWHSTEEAARGTPRLWHLQASSVVLYPVPVDDSHTLVLRYARRPGRLVDSSAEYGAWLVTDVDAGAGTVTVDSDDAPVVSTRVDILKGSPGFESACDSVTVTGVTGSTGAWVVALDGDTSRVEAGDYMAEEGTAPVAQVPLDWLAVLESSVKEQLQRDTGDAGGAAAEAQARALMVQQASATMNPRSNEPEVCVPGTDFL